MGKISDAFKDTTLPIETKKKVIALDKEFSEQQSQIQVLESANLKLQAEVNPLKREIERLNNQIQGVHSQRLDKTAEEILVFISRHENFTAPQVAQATGVSEQLATYHLEELKKHELIDAQYTMGNDFTGARPRTSWHIKQPGRAYLVSHKLIA